MVTLAVDLCLQEGSVAVGKDGEVLSVVSWGNPRAHAERVFEEINRSLRACSFSKEKIKEVVVTVGPGSFTGVRLSVTVGKAFKVCGIKVYGISTLEALSLGLETTGLTPIPVLYAKRGKFYALVNGKPLDETEENLITFVEKVKNPLIVFKGNPPEKLIKKFPYLEEETPLAKKILKIEKDELQPLNFLYLRNHDAKPQYKSGKP